PQLVSDLSFIIPAYRWWEPFLYRIGLKFYDLLAGKLVLKPSEVLSPKETLLRIPTLEPKNLRAGILYHDGQFDDARLAITLAQTAVDHGAVLLNYMEAVSFIKERGKMIGVNARDLETGQEYPQKAKVVINATGVFVDNLRKLDDPAMKPMVSPSQGVHLVLDRSFMPSETAILIPETEDGRVLFLIPWHRHLIVGTTDTPIKEAALEPKPLQEEIDFILNCARKFLTKAPTRKDILSAFAGLRPLAKIEGVSQTASLARDHVISISKSGLITITGGKWTTYRKMAESVIDKAIALKGLTPLPCRTRHLPLHGFKRGRHPVNDWIAYGTDTARLETLIQERPDLGHLLHPRLPYLPVEVIWAVREEMARTLEDVLARRTRSLFLDAKAALEIAPKVAALMAHELGKNKHWIDSQIEQFKKTANCYLGK
ncbi:MAG: FAD-dependent oxidoreductase, partial [Chlamydiae bacterium RIFCSPHIGHO2_12_FULL_49_9]